MDVLKFPLLFIPQISIGLIMLENTFSEPLHLLIQLSLLRREELFFLILTEIAMFIY